MGFRGSFAEFAKFLRSDPQFYFKSESELLEAYRALSRRIDPLLVKVFRTLPRMPYGIEPVPSNIAPDSPAGLYRGPAADGSRAGTFTVNTFKPEIRPKYEMMALSLHEGVPGHHLQIGHRDGATRYCRTFGATAAIRRLSKDGDCTPSRSATRWVSTTIRIRSSDSSCTRSGAPAGSSSTPACTIFHWDRQKAIDFMMENTAKQELEVAAEIDRYIVWPGQALAYKVGQLKISSATRKSASKSWATNSISATSTTSCSRMARCRWIGSKRRWMRGSRNKNRTAPRTKYQGWETGLPHAR